MKQLVLVALVGCGALFGKGPHVPGRYQGTIQVTVHNTAPLAMCGLLLFQDGGPEENWLGDPGKEQPIAPGDQRVYSVAPGVYHIIAGVCENGQVVGSYGTYGAATRRIDRTTSIAMGPKPVLRVAGVRMWFNHMYTAQAPVEQGGGEEPAAEEPAAETTSSSSSSSSESSGGSAPSGPACMAHGAAGCDDSHFCCPGNACVSRTKYSDGSLGFGYCQ